MGPKLNRDWVGLRVRVNRDCQNMLAKIPAGTVGEIDSYSREGISFAAERCTSCGVRVLIYGLRRFDFEILTPTDEWPDTRAHVVRKKKEDAERKKKFLGLAEQADLTGLTE